MDIANVARVLMVVVIVGFSARAEDESWINDFMINMTGSYRTAEDVELTISLEEPSGGVISYQISHGETQAGGGESWSVLNAPWFVFVQDAARYWCYDGRGSLVLTEFVRADDGSVEARQKPVEYQNEQQRKSLPAPVAQKVGATL